jgi:hypothetical protein
MTFGKPPLFPCSTREAVKPLAVLPPLAEERRFEHHAFPIDLFQYPKAMIR